MNIFFVNIIYRSSEEEIISLDGSGIRDFFRPYPGSQFAYAQVPVSAGIHRLSNPNKNGGFLAYVYGFGDNNNTESYGYGVGFNLDIQLDIGGSFDLTNDTLVICEGSAIKLETGEYFEKHVWKSGEITPSIIVSQEGMYTVTATTKEGCQKTDSLYVKVEHAEISLGNDTTVCFSNNYYITAKKGFSQYRWQDGSTGQRIAVRSTGDYSVTVTNENNCQADAEAPRP
jgi:hypothetical protein